jgi:hypothetical protein
MFIAVLNRQVQPTQKPVIGFEMRDWEIKTTRQLDVMPTRWGDYQEPSQHTLLITLSVFAILFALLAIGYLFVLPRFTASRSRNNEALLGEEEYTQI